jgi:hypothetical protein
MTVNTAIHAKELVIAKSEGLGPHAVMTMLSVIKGNQFFRIQTARQAFDFYITPKGYLRVEQPRHVKRVHEILRRSDNASSR